MTHLLLKRQLKFEFWSMEKKDINAMIKKQSVIIITFCILGLGGVFTRPIYFRRKWASLIETEIKLFSTFI